jgi:hypothetical protein
LRRGAAAIAALAISGVGLTAAASPDAGAPAACEAKVAAFARWIADAPREPSFVSHSEDLRLVERTSPGLVEPLVQVPTIEVRARGPAYKFGYDTYETIEGLRHALIASRNAEDPPRSAPRLILAIERDAKWSPVAAAVAAAGASGFDPIEFAFARVFRFAGPAVLTADTRRILQLENPFDRTRNAAISFQTVAKPCPAAMAVLGHLATVRPDEKLGLLVDELPPALKRCQCATDPADMAQVVWLFLMPSPDGVVRRSIIEGRIRVAAPGAPATVVRAKKDAPWSEVYPRLLEAAKPGPKPARVRLEVRGR